MASTEVITEVTTEVESKPPQKREIVWFNVILFGISHILGLYGLKPSFIDCKPVTTAFMLTYGYASGFGVTGGVHRLWTHRSYKAKLPLRILLAGCYLSSGMNSIYDWVRDHRVHHKFSETDADPHNAKRGFFFSHVGWLLERKHPEVARRGREIDMSDVIGDPVVAFAEKYYRVLWFSLTFIIPTLIPPLLFGETWWNAVFSTLTRWMLTLNAIWSVNSFAHIYGNRPYNRNINPAENLGVSIFALGEGWHNYHHTFPWDYKAAELGLYHVNFTAGLIDFFSLIGWAYDLKQPSPKLVQKVIETQGDGTHWTSTESPHEIPYEKEEKIKAL